MFKAVAALAVAACVAVAFASVQDCTYTTPSGITYDFTPLIAKNGSYQWTQTSYNVAGKNVYTISPDDAVTYHYELQVCGNIAKSQFASCTQPSPMNRISENGTVCEKWGDFNVSVFDQNPFDDGAYLNYYHGDNVDHIHKYHTRVYFQCDPTATEPRPYFEHMLEDYAVHIKFFNTIACKTN